MEKYESSDSESSSDIDNDPNWIWEKLVILSSHNDQLSSLELFKGYLRLHIDSKENTLFKSIMTDVNDEIPLQKIIRKHKRQIIDAVNECRESDDSDDFDNCFWGSLVEKGRDCRWMTGKSCYCEEHNGMSMLDTTCFFVKLFIDMDKDPLIKRIEGEIEKNEDDEISTVIDHVVNDYDGEILEALQDARKSLYVCGSWNKHIFWQ